MSNTIQNELHGFMLIAQGAHENCYCNGRRHIRTDGGYDQPPKALEDTIFRKQATTCDCPGNKLMAYPGFIGLFPKDPRR
jgi:hypothetical protein